MRELTSSVDLCDKMSHGIYLREQESINTCGVYSRPVYTDRRQKSPM